MERGGSGARYPPRMALITPAPPRARGRLPFVRSGELTSGDMSMFHRLFGKERREGYLAHVEDACERAIEALPQQGEIELFEHSKRLVHRLGFRAWAGPEAASPRYLETLTRLFEQLDPEQAFLKPATAVVTIATKNAPERRALAAVTAILRDIYEARQQQRRVEDDMLEELHRMYAAQSEHERHALVARDVMVLHLASLSNLYAAIGWTFVHLLGDAEHRERVMADDAFLDALSEEAIRMAQRSITLRKVMRPMELASG